MLSEFLAATSSPLFEEDGWLRFRSAEWDNRDLVLKVIVEGPEVSTQQWRILCGDVRTARLTGEATGDVELTSQHPLLWPHVEAHADLYFNGRADSPRD